MVAAALTLHVTAVTTTTAATATGSKRTCVYKTTFPVPDTIVFGSPVTAAKFAATQAAAATGVAVVTVHGIGTAAWAIKAGNGMAVLTGTLEIVISAPATTDTELEALAKKIL